MSDIVLQVENLSKEYRLGKQERYKTFRDTLANAFTAMFRHSSGSRTDNMIWALKDVSFQIKRGEVVGIIGLNGAGKSTLLKILSRITEPTEGIARIHGRVGSLLEVGTGFHPELTGRENIVLNGAILGMKRREIAAKFDEIVAFSELEKFIDTPVKHYSSGMYMRLAFAVAAHLEPDILLVDEVLAIGDAAFQKKCLGKMEKVKEEGRAVLYVSHNLAQLRQLCQKGILIDQGKILYSDFINEVVSQYEKNISLLEKSPLLGTVPKQEGFMTWQIKGSLDTHTLQTEGNFEMVLHLRLTHAIDYAAYVLILKTYDGSNIACWNKKGMSLEAGDYRLVFKFPGLPVKPGIYYWYTSLWDGARKVDVAYLHPPLNIATPLHSSLPEEWMGMMNLPFKMEVQKTYSAQNAK